MPLLLLLIPGSLLLSLANWRIRFQAGGKRVAVLGDTSTGKTTLLAHLQEGGSRSSRRRNPGVEASDEFSLKVKGRTIDFRAPTDFSGNDGLGLAGWKKAFVGSHHVWYLFRADLIAAGDPLTVDTVKTHIDTFRNWLDKDKFPPPIVLIGTHADASVESGSDVDRFFETVANAHPIRTGTVKLRNAGLVVGSLESSKTRTKLISDLSRLL